MSQYLAGAPAKYDAIMTIILLRIEAPKMAHSKQISCGSRTKMVVFYYLFCLKTGHFDSQNMSTPRITAKGPGHFEGPRKIDLQVICPSQRVPEREKFGGGPALLMLTSMVPEIICISYLHSFGSLLSNSSKMGSRSINPHRFLLT